MASQALLSVRSVAVSSQEPGDPIPCPGEPPWERREGGEEPVPIQAVPFATAKGVLHSRPVPASPASGRSRP